MTRPTEEPVDPELKSVLERARTLGFLGPGPLRAHVDHARRYSRCLRDDLAFEAGRLLDLGSGNGLPGVPLLLWNPGLRATLLDAGQRRCAFLREVLEELALEDRADVLEGRAEDLGHRLDVRAAFDVVVSRGFGPPAITVECALPFLRSGGALVISEPPVRRAWKTLDLGDATLRPDTSAEGLIILRLEGHIDPSLPRSINRQRRRPLFEFD